MLASYVNALADLAQPKASMPLLHDQARLNAYQIALSAALHELPGDMRNAVISGLMTPCLLYILLLPQPLAIPILSNPGVPEIPAATPPPPSPPQASLALLPKSDRLSQVDNLPANSVLVWPRVVLLASILPLGGVTYAPSALIT